jgi:hypothetical protein
MPMFQNYFTGAPLAELLSLSTILLITNIIIMVIIMATVTTYPKIG